MSLDDLDQFLNLRDSDPGLAQALAQPMDLDQFQQHPTSPTWADADLNGGTQQVVPGCLLRIWIGF